MPSARSLEARQLGAHLEFLAERRCHVVKDRPRRQSRKHLEGLLAGLLGTAQAYEEIGATCTDIDQLAFQDGDLLVQVRGARVKVKSEPDERSARDPDVDVARRRGSLRGSH